MGIRSRKKVEKKRKAIKTVTKQITKLKKKQRIQGQEDIKNLLPEEQGVIAAAK